MCYVVTEMDQRGCPQ